MRVHRVWKWALIWFNSIPPALMPSCSSCEERAIVHFVWKKGEKGVDGEAKRGESWESREVWETNDQRVTGETDRFTPLLKWNEKHTVTEEAMWKRSYERQKKKAKVSDFTILKKSEIQDPEFVLQTLTRIEALILWWKEKDEVLEKGKCNGWKGSQINRFSPCTTFDVKRSGSACRKLYRQESDRIQCSKK